jgi:predicted nucleic acid-binding protein
VDRTIAELAWQIRVATPARLPLADAVIAATARSVDGILVHRDPHLAAIPHDLVEQVALPES